MSVEVIGTLIAESLAPDAVIDVSRKLRRLHRIRVNSAAGQPTIWTLIDFACQADDVDAFVRQLAASLASGPWYTDLATATTKYVVFSGRVFVYARGDEAGYAEAASYARRVGVPEAQLDWPS